eukprot:TRINITY_DN4149_c0_g1_i1.p2 TRINITY_DN4149_c0_g1~~TRINITY_DN4149_c0_g1_i1.p2  ORF type:complete len:272 (+),score=39.55 TRINITY_DN4149_c0_g1_i1:95-817(+)
MAALMELTQEDLWDVAFLAGTPLAVQVTFLASPFGRRGLRVAWRAAAKVFHYLAPGRRRAAPAAAPGSAAPPPSAGRDEPHTPPLTPRRGCGGSDRGSPVWAEPASATPWCPSPTPGSVPRAAAAFRSAEGTLVRPPPVLAPEPTDQGSTVEGTIPSPVAPVTPPRRLLSTRAAPPLYSPASIGSRSSVYASTAGDPTVSARGRPRPRPGSASVRATPGVTGSPRSSLGASPAAPPPLLR